MRLFPAGLSLRIATTLGPGSARSRILAAIRDLDDTISQIRTTIFQLQLHHGIAVLTSVRTKARHQPPR